MIIKYSRMLFSYVVVTHYVAIDIRKFTEMHAGMVTKNT